MDPRSLTTVFTNVKDDGVYVLGSELGKLKTLFTSNQFSLWKKLKNSIVQRRAPRRYVFENHSINFVIQSAATLNLAVTSEFNYDLIML